MPVMCQAHDLLLGREGSTHPFRASWRLAACGAHSNTAILLPCKIARHMQRAVATVLILSMQAQTLSTAHHLAATAIISSHSSSSHTQARASRLPHLAMPSLLSPQAPAPRPPPRLPLPPHLAVQPLVALATPLGECAPFSSCAALGEIAAVLALFLLMLVHLLRPSAAQQPTAVLQLALSCWVFSQHATPFVLQRRK